MKRKRNTRGVGWAPSEGHSHGLDLYLTQPWCVIVSGITAGDCPIVEDTFEILALSSIFAPCTILLYLLLLLSDYRYNCIWYKNNNIWFQMNMWSISLISVLCVATAHCHGACALLHGVMPEFSLEDVSILHLRLYLKHLTVKII